ncbi:MAG: glycosyltransferase family 4 protein [Verrucomicrobia bacterium]|nr:glycosyltransferase family 4 protein [Verrucomicrobiota bacterium]
MSILSEDTRRSSVPATPSFHFSGRRVAAVVYSTYPADPRPRRAAEALAGEGASVEVICLKETDEEPFRECFNGVKITRVPLKRRRGGKLSYLLQYGTFILASGAILAGRTLRRRYDVVHVHNMPDILVFSALVPKLLGARVILDLHDPMPELMMAIFGLQENASSVRLLRALEKCSLAFADAVITVNETFKQIFLARSCPARKINVVMNSPDEQIFQARRPAGRDPAKPFVIMYHGSLVERHGLDLAVTALAKLRQSIPSAELRVYGGSTPFLEQVMDQVRQLQLGDAVRYLGRKKLEHIAEAIRECDVGIIPNRRSLFTELNTPTRIFEYLSQGKPVIAPRTPGILDYFSEQELVFFELGDADDLALKLEHVFRHPVEMLRMVDCGQAVYSIHRWSSERLRFLTLVDGLLKRGRQSLRREPAPRSDFRRS